MLYYYEMDQNGNPTTPVPMAMLNMANLTNSIEGGAWSRLSRETRRVVQDAFNELPQSVREVLMASPETATGVLRRAAFFAHFLSNIAVEKGYAYAEAMTAFLDFWVYSAELHSGEI